jgi:hypothetical protein
MAASAPPPYPLDTMPACPHTEWACPTEHPCGDPAGWPEGRAPPHRCYRAWLGGRVRVGRWSRLRYLNVPCLPFLTTPSALVSGPPTRWPDHFCEPVAVYLLGQWYRRQWGSELTHWPLPLHPEGQSRPLLPPDALQAAMEELPLRVRGPVRSGDARNPERWALALALSVPLRHGRLDLLGLVHTMYQGSMFPWDPGPLAILLQGGALAVPEAVDYIQPVRRWWARFQAFGHKIEEPAGMGRPPGGELDRYTLGDLRDKFRAFGAAWRRDHEGDPSMASFARADGISVDPSILKAHLRKKYGMTWLRFVEYCR